MRGIVGFVWFDPAERAGRGTSATVKPLKADEAWQAAHVDEDWNIEQWGRDELALERRAFRFAELQAAAVLQNS